MCVLPHVWVSREGIEDICTACCEFRYSPPDVVPLVTSVRTHLSEVLSSSLAPVRAFAAIMTATWSPRRVASSSGRNVVSTVKERVVVYRTQFQVDTATNCRGLGRTSSHSEVSFHQVTQLLPSDL